jgi:large subunit ribosomal protein L25
MGSSSTGAQVSRALLRAWWASLDGHAVPRLSRCASSLPSTGTTADTTDRTDRTDRTGATAAITLHAEARTASGSRAARKLRAQDRIPGTVFSFSDETRPAVLLSFDRKEIASIHKKIGSYGWGCQVFDLRVKGAGGDPQSEDVVRALGRQIHVTASSAEPENVTMIAYPPERKVRVEVPLRTFGMEASPGIRAGGRVNWIRRTVPCVVEKGEVPQYFEVDISELEVNDKVLWTSLQIPEGVTVLLKDARQPVLKMARK